MSNITIYHTFQEKNQYADFIVEVEILLDIDLLHHASSLEDLLNLLKIDADTFFSRE